MIAINQFIHPTIRALCNANPFPMRQMFASLTSPTAGRGVQTARGRRAQAHGAVCRGRDRSGRRHRFAWDQVPTLGYPTPQACARPDRAGVILTAMKTLKLFEKTLIVYAGVHGDMVETK